MSETCKHGLKAPIGCLVCSDDETAEITADQWKARHVLAMYIAIMQCDDVQTLRALAHRLGYKEGT